MARPFERLRPANCHAMFQACACRAKGPDRAIHPGISALELKPLGGIGLISLFARHMVSRRIRKTRTASRRVARKPYIKEGFSKAVRRTIKDRSEQLIQLYLELGLPWPNALQAAVADLKQLSSYQTRVLSPA